MDDILDLLNDVSIPTRCKTCNGTGLVMVTKEDGYSYFKKCTDCNTQQQATTDLSHSTEDLYEKYKIPESYRQKAFYITNLDKYIDRVNNINLIEYKKTLSGIYKKIEQGGIIKNSYYIHLDDLNIEYNFVYACIQIALNTGLTVTPYIDTLELDMLTVNAIQPDRHKEVAKRIGFHIDNFYTADYVFIKLNELMSKETSTRNIQLLKDLLDRRARQGKPTMLISSKPYNYIKAVDSRFTSELVVTQKVQVGHSKFIYVSLEG